MNQPWISHFVSEHLASRSWADGREKGKSSEEECGCERGHWRKTTEWYTTDRKPNIFQKFLRVNHSPSVRSFSGVGDRLRATRPDIDAPSAKISGVIHQVLDERGTYQNWILSIFFETNEIPVHKSSRAGYVRVQDMYFQSVLHNPTLLTLILSLQANIIQAIWKENSSIPR
jgi:hypothetical protein